MYRCWSAEIQRRSDIRAYTRYFRVLASFWMHCSRLRSHIDLGEELFSRQFLNHCRLRTATTPLARTRLDGFCGFLYFLAQLRGASPKEGKRKKRRRSVRPFTARTLTSIAT